MAHCTRVGDVEIFSLLDVGDWKLANFFPSVPPDVWETYRALYPGALCELHSICTTRPQLRPKSPLSSEPVVILSEAKDPRLEGTDSSPEGSE